MNKYLMTATLSLGAFGATPAHAQSVFADVPDNHWAAAAVKRLAEAGIIEGYPSGIATQPATAASTETPKPHTAGRFARINTQMIKAALESSAKLKGSRINVDAVGTAVTLSGTVTSTAQKTLAEDIAYHEMPVCKIVNQLKVIAPPKTHR